MPCMYNGKPVKGAKGACPAGSTWVEDGQSAPATSNNQLFRDSKIFGNWFDPENYTRFKPTGKVSQMLEDGAITNWADNLQGYIDDSPRLSKIDKGMNDFFASMGMEAYNKTDKTPEKANFVSANEQRRQTFDHKIPKQLSKWEQLSANFKDPKWWAKSISGLPHDTRLHRLGMLMDYYGRTPKGRAAVDMPAEVWAKNEQDALANRAAAEAAKAKKGDEVYGKKSIEDLATDLLPDVKEMFGDRMFTFSSNPNASDDEMMKSLAEQVATNIKAISNAYPEMTPGEVRELALQQLMKDRKLEDLR